MAMGILPSARSGFDVLGEAIGGGMQRAMPQMYENQKFQRGMSAIDQLQESLKPKFDDQGNQIAQDQGEVLANLARMQAQLPGFERSPYMEHVMKMVGAQAAQNAPLPGQKRDRDVSEYQVPSRGEGVNFLNKPSEENRFFPTNKGPAGNIGSAPQQATQGVKRPVKSPQELIKEAPRYAKELTDAQIPTKPMEAYEILKSQNEDNRKYNEEVDKETGQRILSQEKYGKKGLDALKEMYTNPSSEMEAVAKQWGEEASRMGEAGEASEGKIEQFINNKVKDLSDAVTNAKKTLSAPRVFDKIERGVDGTYRDFESSAKDVRNHLKPLLDLGLYEEARGVLQDLGYGPEEREMVVNPLSQMAQTTMNSLPVASGTSNFRKITGRAEPTIANMKQTLVNLNKNSPNFSPLLARKYAEDKGYDWGLFKDAWNELLEEDAQGDPENPKFKLSGDQIRQSGKLNSPPLNKLDKFLHSLDLIGR